MIGFRRHKRTDVRKRVILKLHCPEGQETKAISGEFCKKKNVQTDMSDWTYLHGYKIFVSKVLKSRNPHMY